MDIGVTRSAKKPVFVPLEATESFVWKTSDLFANMGSRGQRSLVGCGVTPH